MINQNFFRRTLPGMALALFICQGLVPREAGAQSSDRSNPFEGLFDRSRTKGKGSASSTSTKSSKGTSKKGNVPKKTPPVATPPFVPEQRPLDFAVPVFFLSHDVEANYATSLAIPKPGVITKEAGTSISIQSHQDNPSAQLRVIQLPKKIKATEETARLLAESEAIQDGDVLLSFRHNWASLNSYCNVQMGISHVAMATIDKDAKTGKRYVHTVESPLSYCSRLNYPKHYADLDLMHILRPNLTESQKKNVREWLLKIRATDPNRITFFPEYGSPYESRGMGSGILPLDLAKTVMYPKTAMTVSVYCSELGWAVLALRDIDPADLKKQFPEGSSKDPSEWIKGKISPIFEPLPGGTNQVIKMPGLMQGPDVQLRALMGADDAKRRDFLLKNVLDVGAANPAATQGVISSNHLTVANQFAATKLPDLQKFYKANSESEAEALLPRLNLGVIPNYSPTAFFALANLPKESRKFSYVGTVSFLPKPEKAPASPKPVPGAVASQPATAMSAPEMTADSEEDARGAIQRSTAMPAAAIPPPSMVGVQRSEAVLRPPIPEAKKLPEFSKMEVFYATDRQRTTLPAADQRYGTKRNNEGDHLEYGKAIVTIPHLHVAGQVERPKWWKLEFKEDQEKHVVLLEPELMDASKFYSSIHDTARSRPANELLMFVHGFNVAWGDAIRRTGQLSHDIGFGGVTFSYSWPSQGDLKKYSIDKESSEWTIPHLTQVLEDLQTKSKVGRIHIIAHSMGTRALSYAIANAKDAGIKLNLDNIILAAPDMDRDIFKAQILPKMTPQIKRLTMYSSSNDAALKVSGTFNGSPRLGLSGKEIFVMKTMDTIDASGIDTSLLGHSYYGSQHVVVKDIFGVIIKDLVPTSRSLKPGRVGEWALPKEVKVP